MNILYVDFIIPAMKQATMATAVDAMNDWIRKNGADVVSVETLLNVIGEFTRTEQRGIRCWYREQAPELKKPL